jgi:phosphoribosylamine--glycine ligase
MNILLVGSGGREHALAWKILRSPSAPRLICAPGNPGIAGLCETRPIKADDIDGLVALGRDMAADLVVIGPDATIAAGLADRLAEVGIACFGPTQAAGRLESSKAFAKAFAERHGLPAGRFAVFDDAPTSKAALDAFAAPYVIKADGLAAGKVVSVFALCDGETVVMFGGAQDHKPAFDGDQGPNTGGMGAYAPAPALDAAMMEQIRAQLIAPALAGIAREGAPSAGVLFCETMITADGPRLIEFNARFGDPETQVLMLAMKSDLVPYLAAAAGRGLANAPAVEWSDGAVICVVVAAAGYPGAPATGAVIEGAEDDHGSDVIVFHAGTARRDDGALVTAGGRILNVCARGATLAEAAARAYDVVGRIHIDGAFHRSDIGWRGLAAERRLASASPSG